MQLIRRSLVRALSGLFTLPRLASFKPLQTAPLPEWVEATSPLTLAMQAADVPNVIPGCDACAFIGRPCVEHRNLPRSFGKRTPEESARIRDKLAEDLAEKRWRPADEEAEFLAEKYNGPREPHGYLMGAMGAAAENKATTAAARTLQRLGWSWRGGVEWRPPMGPMPDFDLLDKLKSEYEERLAVLDSKRQDLEERLRVAEARADVREASCLETARHLGEIEGWKRRARDQEALATGALNFIGWLRKTYGVGKNYDLTELIDAWLDHEEKITATVEEWASEPIAEERKRGDELAAAIIFAIEKGGEADSWLTDYNEGHPAALAELHKWRVENGDTGAAAMQGAAVVGRNGLPDVPVAVGRERPGAAPVQPGGEGRGVNYGNLPDPTPGAGAGDIRPVRQELSENDRMSWGGFRD